MRTSVQDALVDRVGRFAQELVYARNPNKQKVSFRGFNFEHQKNDKGEVILIRDGDKLFLKLSRPGPADLWTLEKHAQGVLERICSLHMSWKQAFDLEKFKDTHVRRKTEASGQAAPA